AALAAPVSWLWRRVRRVKDVPPGRRRRTEWLAALMGLVNIGVLTAMTYVLYQLVQAAPHPILARLGLIWNATAVAAGLSLALVVLVGRDCAAAWRQGWWSPAGRVYYTLVALVAVCWVPFVFYWDFVRPAW